MKEGFRQSMAWLHTWAGLLLGWLLFAIFVTGTLSFFKNELNLWMRPELTQVGALAPDSFGRVQQRLDELASTAEGWSIRMPDARTPGMQLFWFGPRPDGKGRKFENRLIDPATGQDVSERKTMGGEFFYRFHFELRSAEKSKWIIEGRYLVGVGTMAMFIALITGIITHRRIFKDFFVFRGRKGGLRAWLDAHNVLGVMVLPFYLMITFSGLVIFQYMYMPSATRAAYGADGSAFFREAAGIHFNDKLDEGVTPIAIAPTKVPLDAIVAQASRTWPGGRIGTLSMQYASNGVPTIEAVRHDGDRLQYRGERLVFDARDGRLIERYDVTAPAARTYGVLYGLHLARFATPFMRWALFLFGVAGSAMIGSGLVLWVKKRRAQGLKGFDLRLVDTLNAAALAGLPVAIGAYFWANRLLPLDMEGRVDAELRVYFIVWGLCLLLACLRTATAWRVLLYVGAVVYLLLPWGNALTSDIGLQRTLPAGNWAMAGVDLSFIACGLLMAWIGRRLGRPAPVVARKGARPATPALAQGEP
ncbi:MAG: PepSY-associated TM helix domain-containing protein [Rhodocyclaceae bacterium]